MKIQPRHESVTPICRQTKWYMKVATQGATLPTSLPTPSVIAPKPAPSFIRSTGSSNGAFKISKALCSRMRCPVCSKVTERVYQEFYGRLACNVTRPAAFQAAVSFDRFPCDVQFNQVAQYIARQLIVMAAADLNSATERRWSKLRTGIGGLFLDRRPNHLDQGRRRRFPRPATQWIGRLLRLSEQH